MPNNPLTPIALREDPQARMITLDDLFFEALTYGRPRLATSEKKQFWASIEFETIAVIVLKAEHSGFTSTPHEALQKAIDKAKEIRSAFK